MRESSLARVSKNGVADEERAHLADELRRLTRASHRLNEVRERVKLRADETDHELVVVRVDAVTREANVVRQVLRAVRFSDVAVFTQYAAALARFELLEGAVSAERILDGPGPALV